MSYFSKVVFQVCSVIHSVAQQRNDVTGALLVVINALYDERMHDDVLKTTSNHNIVGVLHL